MASSVVRQRLEAKGHEVYNRLQDVFKSGGQEEDAPIGLNEHYRNEVESHSDLALDVAMLRVMSNAGSPIEGYYWHNVLGEQQGKNAHGAYNNYVHGSGSTIICCYNFSDEDPNRGSAHQMRWSDLMTGSSKEGMDETGGQMSNLKDV